MRLNTVNGWFVWFTGTLDLWSRAHSLLTPLDWKEQITTNAELTTYWPWRLIPCISPKCYTMRFNKMIKKTYSSMHMWKRKIYFPTDTLCMQRNKKLSRSDLRCLKIPENPEWQLIPPSIARGCTRQHKLSCPPCYHLPIYCHAIPTALSATLPPFLFSSLSIR